MKKENFNSKEKEEEKEPLKPIAGGVSNIVQNKINYN
jgi:hypothetical protein